MSHRYFEDGPAPNFGNELITELKKKCPFIFLVCFRDKNKNVVIYQARVKDNKLLDPPVEAYWLILEPSYRESRRKQKISHDREELGFLDHKFAWGFEQKRLSDTEASFSFKNFNHSMIMKLNNNTVQLFTSKDNRKYLIRSLYIAASENIKIFNMRDNVKELYLSGTDITEKPYKPTKIRFK